MNQAELHDINKYCSPSSILVINANGELIRLYCPFEVQVVQSVNAYSIGDILTVVQVKMDAQYTLVYIIDNKGYYYWNFILL
jgi:hypothetical protein